MISYWYDCVEILKLWACVMLLAESFDACPILYIGYDVHETSILCLKLVWLIKLWDILWWLSYDSYLKNIRYANAYLMCVLCWSYGFWFVNKWADKIISWKFWCLPYLMHKIRHVLKICICISYVLETAVIRQPP